MPINNSIRLVAKSVGLLAEGGMSCHVFGGWAEEMLGLRPAGSHKDIDLIYCAPDFTDLDEWLRRDRPALTEVVGKRFAHKRAFMLDGVMCEVLLVTGSARCPVTLFWGDVPFFWSAPLLHECPVESDGVLFSVVSAANVRGYRARHGETQPHRWRDRPHTDDRAVIV